MEDSVRDNRTGTKCKIKNTDLILHNNSLLQTRALYWLFPHFFLFLLVSRLHWLPKQAKIKINFKIRTIKKLKEVTLCITNYQCYTPKYILIARFVQISVQFDDFKPNISYLIIKGLEEVVPPRDEGQLVNLIDAFVSFVTFSSNPMTI